MLTNWFTVLIISGLTAGLDKQIEYCAFESFEPSCPPNNVVLMKMARYGRMRVGRCMTRDHSIGCSLDILQWADQRCSARTSCSIPVLDQDLYKIQDCPRDLGVYLEADYECVEVQTPGSKLCHAYKPLQATVPEGYLAKQITDSTGYGTEPCPWTITMPVGQTINLTLYDFAVYNRSQYDGKRCEIYAIITESGRTETVCGGFHRTQHIYMSTTNQVDINLRSFPNKGSNYMIKYQGVGCPDLPQPRGGWVHRSGDTVVLGCNQTSAKWHLVCKDTQWVGKFYNCSLPGHSRLLERSHRKQSSRFPLGLLISVVIGIITGIILGGSMLAVLLMYRRRRERRQVERQASSFQTGRLAVPDSGYSDSTESKQLRVPSSQGSGYAHIWQLRQEETPSGARRPPAYVREGSMLSTGSQDIDYFSTMSRSYMSQRSGEHIYESPEYLKRDAVTTFRNGSHYPELDSSISTDPEIATVMSQRDLPENFSRH